MMITVPGIDPERLHRRARFLHSRAMVHMEMSAKDVRHTACAATLLRDAACIALLLGETTAARRYLKEAGGHFLELGLTGGSPLIVLADATNAAVEFESYSDTIEGIRHQWSREETEIGERQVGPMAYTARSSLRQMFSQLQADQLMTEIDGRRSMRQEHPMHEVLKRNGGYPVGNTGLSIDSYKSTADWLTEQRSQPHRQIPEFVTATFVTLATTRAEHIRAAMKDKFNWAKLSRPSELLDFDSVIVMFLAFGARMNRDFLRMSQWTGEGAIFEAPLIVAEQLRQDQDLSAG